MKKLTVEKVDSQGSSLQMTAGSSSQDQSLLKQPQIEAQGQSSAKTLGEMRAELRLTEKHVEDIQQSFKLFDIFGKGLFSESELQKVAKSIGVQMELDDCREIVSMFDTEGKGAVNLLDFTRAIERSVKEPIKEEDIIGCFKVFEGSGGGFITPTKLHAVFRSLGTDLTPDEVNEIFITHDSDRDGLISYEEFKLIVMQIYSEDFADLDLFSGEEPLKPGSGMET